MESHQERVVLEKRDLDIRIEALRAFINESPVYSKLDVAEQSRLTRQYGHMLGYSEVLMERIAAF